MSDTLIYEEGKIRITKNVFSNGEGDNFVIATIKGIRELHVSKSIIPLFLGLVLIGLAGWREFFTYSQYIMGGLGVVFSLWYFTQSARYRILIITPAGEVEAFSTKDEIQHQNILVCLKRALSLHQA